MTYSLQDRFDQLGTRRMELDSEIVTYSRGTPPSANPSSISSLSSRSSSSSNSFSSSSEEYTELQILASMTKIAGEEIIPGVAVTRVHHNDWFINSADLILGTPTVPLHGDLITRANGEKYRVVSQDGEPPYEYTTSSKKRMRIRTTLV